MASTQRRRLLAGLAVVAVATTGLAACADPATGSTGSGPGSGPAIASAGAPGYVDRARAAGASDEQLVALDDGDVTYAEYETAMNRAFDCMRDANLAVNVAGTKSYHGTTILDYSVISRGAATDSAGSASRDLESGCYDREARFVDMYWQTSTADAVVWNARRDAALGPVLRACVEKDGADVPDDASFADLIHTATDLTQSDPSSDCMGDIGYSTWNG